MSITLKEIRDQVIEDLDLQEEDWKNITDLNSIVNRAIRDAHRKIVNIYEDYFLTYVQQDILSSDNEIEYPSNIFANKIKSIQFYDGVNSVKFTKVKRFDETVMLDNHITTETLQRKWLPVDSETGGRIIRLFPYIGRAGRLTIWYIREPKKLIDDTDICDIDEFSDYVIQLCKKYYYAVDSDPRFITENTEAARLEKDMIDTLTNMDVGNDDEIVQDNSHYEDSV